MFRMKAAGRARAFSPWDTCVDMPAVWGVRRFRAWGAIMGVAVLLALGGLAAALVAQEEGVPTLRVYTDLVQIPTLVLSGSGQAMPVLSQHRVFVRIDGGPPFHVTHVRMEGDDPIALSILLDLNATPQGELPKIPAALAALAPKSLHPVDKVSVYALHCQLVRAVAGESTTAAGLEKGATAALDTLNSAEKSDGAKPCRDRWNLLDAISSMTSGLAEQPARRVMLVYTGGTDEGSKVSWDAVRQVAQARGVAIFAILPPGQEVVPNPAGYPAGSLRMAAVARLRSLCESTGGIVLDRSRASLNAQLSYFVALVRGRYILDFPRPQAPAGTHSLEVSIENMPRAFIRPAGSSFPMPDPALGKDPATILSGPSDAPEVGTKGRER